MGVLSEARPVEGDQTESETDNWKDFFGSESEDDVKISHAAGEADNDEVAIRSGDGHTDAEDPGVRKQKQSRCRRHPNNPHNVNARNTSEHTCFSEIGARTASRPNPGTTQTRETDVMKDEELRDDAIQLYRLTAATSTTNWAR